MSSFPRSPLRARSASSALFGVLFVTLAGACAPGVDLAGDEAAAPAPGATRGELVIYTASYDDGTTEDRFALRVGGNENDERPLTFATRPDVQGGSRIDVWGTPLSTAEGEGLAVSRWAPVRGPRGEIESTAQPLIMGAPLKPRSFAFVLVDLGAGVNVTADEARKRLFGTEAAASPSVRQYYMEASYGRQDIAGEVFGPFPYTMTGCNTRGMTTALRAMIPGTFDHYLWYLGSRVSSCGWTGLASSGSVTKPSRDTWYNASTGCVVLVQEPSHNFGADHSSSMKCPMASFIDAPDKVCTHSEYGDSYDPMGRGCRHMNGAQKEYQRWYDKCNVVEVFQSGTYTLLPLELPCDGTQVLQIAMPKTRPFFRTGGGGSSGVTELTYYYLELRAPYGIDKGLATQVQIRVSQDQRMPSKDRHTWFLDMNPATTTLDGLVAGGSFTDPAGSVKFTVMSLDNGQAKVAIEIQGGTPGPAKCLDGSTLMGEGPGPESCAAAPFSINGAAPPYVPPKDAGASTAMPDPGSGGGGTRRDAGGNGSSRDGGARNDGASGGGVGDDPGSSGGGSKPDAGAQGGGSTPPTTGGGAPGSAGKDGGPASAPQAMGQPAVAGGCSCSLGTTAPSGRAAQGSAPAALLIMLGLVTQLRRRRRG
jgi:MYXO-CTERM domain-containing protein